jgi:hypothetical protein
VGLFRFGRKTGRCHSGGDKEVIMLIGLAKVLGGIILTGIGVVAAAMGAGVTGDGIAETLNSGSAGSSDSSSTLRKAS